MKNYRKKPIEIQAIQWDGTEQMAVDIASNNDFEGMIDFSGGELDGFYVDTLDGRTQISLNDYVIKGSDNQYRVLEKEDFELIYEQI